MSEPADNVTATTVFGFSFDPNDPAVILEYSLANVLVTSLIPVPLAGPMTAVSALLFGLAMGMVINVLTSVVGAWIGLWATRHLCRPCFVRALGRHQKKWEALDAAITSQGFQIALLIRVAPVSPMVATNILLSLTSVSVWTYLWTCAVGIIPANFPYAYAAAVGASLANEFPPRDPVMLSMSILGLVATIGVVWKIGVVAQRALARHGLGDTPAANGNQGGAGRPSSSRRGDVEVAEAAEAAADDDAEAAGRRGTSACGDGGAGGSRNGVELVRCVDVAGRDEPYSETEVSPEGAAPPSNEPGSNKGSSRRLVMRGGLGARRFQQLDERKREKKAAGDELSDELSIDDDDL